jgi:hypothetical protein
MNITVVCDVTPYSPVETHGVTFQKTVIFKVISKGNFQVLHRPMKSNKIFPATRAVGLLCRFNVITPVISKSLCSMNVGVNEFLFKF